jgi:phosphatidylglycerol---prolipoprotein diacylglyceryl transferase
MAPLIPYVELPDVTLVPRDFFGGGFPPFPIAFKPFGTLVATGTYLGAWLIVLRGRRLGFNEKALISFMVYVGGFGFLLGHMLDVLLYFPERLARDPLALFKLWEGLSSYGGFTGALVGALVWKLRHAAPILPYADITASCFPLGWAFGRAGCSLAHDHPGVFSDAWFAVQYPGGARLDLGLIEFVLTLPLAFAFLWLGRRARPWGFFLGSMCIAYAPVRFALDFLRVRDGDKADARYLALTPAQWLSVGLFAAGLGVWLYMKRDPARAVAPPSTPPSFKPEASPLPAGPRR